MSHLGRIVFFGTPEFAVPTLEALCSAGRRPARVVTQPSRPAGRGQRMVEPPVARCARERRLPLMQPASVRSAEVLEDLRALEPDLGVVVAYGEIFPAELLELPRQGCLNVHASLLPRYRGAAPIQRAIAEGETRTGVSVVRMVEKLDAGPILHQEELDIEPEETAGELARRLARLGAEALVRTLEVMEAGKLVVVEQEADLVTWAPKLERADGIVEWNDAAPKIFDRLRAFTPWPGLTTRFAGGPLKVIRARPVEWPQGEGAPGELLGTSGDRLVVRCGGGSALGLERVQRPGRRSVTGADFAHGERLRPGARLG